MGFGLHADEYREFCLRVENLHAVGHAVAGNLRGIGAAGSATLVSGSYTIGGTCTAATSGGTATYAAVLTCVASGGTFTITMT